MFQMASASDVVKTLMVETETKTETWKKIRVQDPRPRLEKFFETEIETW